MAEAEYLLPERQRNTQNVLSLSVNGDERVPTPLSTEQSQKAPSFSVDPSRPPSPNTAHNGHEPHLIKNSAALQANNSKACKKKKKCLSDIFGHIVSGSKEPSVITKVVEQCPTTTLKEEPEDSPYADLDSVPMLQRPKRTAVSPVRDVDRLVGKDRGSTEIKTNFTDEVNHSTDCRDSPGIPAKNLTSKDKNSKESLGSCNEFSNSTKKHSMNLPASSGLMTRALKAEEVTDLKDALATSQISDVQNKGGPDTLTNVSIKTEMSLNWESTRNASFSTNYSSPKRRARKPDKKQIRNGSLIEPKFAGSRVPTERRVEIKTENVPDASSSSSPSSSLSPMDAFQDPKELRFKSLVKEDSSDSELTVFRPDSNYKFSTFLMLLKDMHDTREKEGKPLTLPPSPAVIKEEPLVIPTSAGRDLGSCKGSNRTIKTESGQSGRATAFQNRAGKPKSRTKPIMSADTYYYEGFPINFQMATSDKQRRKQRLPAKLKPGIHGLSSDLADLAYGREFVSGHADLAGPGSCPSRAADASASYLCKNSGSTVAPKKRWQLVEEDKVGVMSEISPEVNGSFSMTASPDQGAEKRTECDSFFSETCSTTGKTEVLLFCLLR